ncbi:PUA domain-containing, cell cycle regulator protein, putative [Eimeria necatrix]|uniref:PUA domain-containing, cell cycle regulator protein, putative n=1 Tax=Eimeria necatrix TaxID=51315 RepID=U6MR97_9EIME|nr:PUA domain-containing, cell cycle regulator protein, putative [Eimeria necatrix]CDJ65009.1 PUA domain-containing, cell cycle regulator protein, putative [Eimeria necatrix]
MMKKFGPEEISNKTIMKSSMQRAVRTQILEEYPRLEPVMEQIWPKKASPVLLKCQNRISLVVLDGKPLFFQHRDKQWVPTLRLLHEYPSMMPKMQVDRGAVKFVLRGSNVMCQGLTSPGGRMEEVPANTVVQIAVEGKELSCAIGITTMSTEEIRRENKGPCIETLTSLNDGLWSFECVGRA